MNPWALLTEVPWIIFVCYWLAGALMTRRTVSRESFASRYGVLFLEIAGFVLVSARARGRAFLAVTFTIVPTLLPLSALHLPGSASPSRSGHAGTLDNIGAPESRSKKTTSSSAVAPTIIFGIRFILELSWLQSAGG